MNDIREIAKGLKEEYNLTDYEALSIAAKMQGNEILKAGLVVASNDSYPSALENIAISMGAGGMETDAPILDALKSICDAIYEK